MKNELVSLFAELAREKGIDRDTLQTIIEDVFRLMLRKRFGNEEPFDVIVNFDKGDLQIWHVREVVEDGAVEDPVLQIPLSQARQIDPECELGEEVAEEIQMKAFDRRLILMAKQLLSQKIRDIEKDNIFEEYSKMIGEIVVGDVYQVRRDEVLVNHGRTELILPKKEQIPKDRYRKGDTIRAVIKSVERINGNPRIVISRADPLFLQRLFEIEVPEIYDGIVEIKKIVREPGERAKVAVLSHDDRVDPVGACVGMKGVRIHAIVRELNNENIDVIAWTDDPVELIRRALQPAKVLQVELDQANRRARVLVKPDQVALAIGKGGQNIRLASALTGYEIDVYRDIDQSEEDVPLEEFADEIAPEIIERLKAIGCDTARSVLQLSQIELERRTGLPASVIQEIYRILEEEFEEGEYEEEA
ncbi:MAG: transcription termination factor NusA [Bacteroidetes bacterium]|nr:transcription termination factor NusA [Bacteroidota bacterium]